MLLWTQPGSENELKRLRLPVPLTRTRRRRHCSRLQTLWMRLLLRLQMQSRDAALRDLNSSLEEWLRRAGEELRRIILG